MTAEMTNEDWQRFGEMAGTLKSHGAAIEAQGNAIHALVEKVSRVENSVNNTNTIVRAQSEKIDAALDRRGNGRNLKSYGTLGVAGAGGGGIIIAIIEILKSWLSSGATPGP